MKNVVVDSPLIVYTDDGEHHIYTIVEVWPSLEMIVVTPFNNEKLVRVTFSSFSEMRRERIKELLREAEEALAMKLMGLKPPYLEYSRMTQMQLNKWIELFRQPHVYHMTRASISSI